MDRYGRKKRTGKWSRVLIERPKPATEFSKIAAGLFLLNPINRLAFCGDILIILFAWLL